VRTALSSSQNCYNSFVDSVVDLFCGFKLPSWLAILTTFGVIIAFLVVIGVIVSDSINGLLADREKWATQWRSIIKQTTEFAAQQGVQVTAEEVNSAAGTFLLDNVVTPLTALIPAAITYTFLTLAFLVFVVVSPSTFFGDADVLTATDPDELSCSDDEVQDDELAAAVDNVITAQAAAILIDDDDDDDDGILGDHSHARAATAAAAMEPLSAAAATRGSRRHKRQGARRRTMVDRSSAGPRAGLGLDARYTDGPPPRLATAVRSDPVTPGTVRRWQADVSLALAGEPAGGGAGPRSASAAEADAKHAPTSGGVAAGDAARRHARARTDAPASRATAESDSDRASIPGRASDGRDHSGTDEHDAAMHRGARWAPPGGDAPPAHPLVGPRDASSPSSGVGSAVNSAGEPLVAGGAAAPSPAHTPPSVADAAHPGRASSPAAAAAQSAASGLARVPGVAATLHAHRAVGSGPSPRSAGATNRGAVHRHGSAQSAKGLKAQRSSSHDSSVRRRRGGSAGKTEAETTAGRARAGSNLMHKANKVLEVVGLGPTGGSTTEVEEDTEDEIPAELVDASGPAELDGRFAQAMQAVDRQALEENRRRLRAWARRQKRTGRYRDNSEAAAVLLHQKAQRRVTRYIVVHTWLSAATALGVGLSLWAISAPLPALFGLLAFVLNFIPSVGSWIATLLPIPFILFDPDTGYDTLLLAILLPGFMQILLGNFVEPALLGKLCKVDPIVILVSILLFGYVWGIAGMILAVPMVVIIKLVFKQMAHPIPRYIAGMIYGNLYRYRARLDRDVRRRIRYERLLRAAETARKTAEEAAFGSTIDQQLSMGTPPPSASAARSGRGKGALSAHRMHMAAASSAAGKHIRWSQRLDGASGDDVPTVRLPSSSIFDGDVDVPSQKAEQELAAREAATGIRSMPSGSR